MDVDERDRPPEDEPDKDNPEVMVPRPIDELREEMEVYNQEKSQALREGEST